jgi:hypothetical protein
VFIDRNRIFRFLIRGFGYLTEFSCHRELTHSRSWSSRPVQSCTGIPHLRLSSLFVCQLLLTAFHSRIPAVVLWLGGQGVPTPVVTCWLPPLLRCVQQGVRQQDYPALRADWHHPCCATSQRDRHMQRQGSRLRGAPRITLSDDTIRSTPVTTTLLDLVTTLQECTPNDVELVATIVFLINSGRVRLCGTFAGARIDVATVAGAAPFFSFLPPGWPAGRRPADAPRRWAVAGSAVGTRSCGRAAQSSGSHCSAQQNLLSQKHRRRTLPVPQ